MQQQEGYPKIRIRSKNELAKRISSRNFPAVKALKLINMALGNFDKYWHDVKVASVPIKNKFVRSAKYTPLEKLLKLINSKILAPYDALVPDFIFGGLSGRNHIQAGYYLLGSRRKRTKLSLDIYRFFEQIDRDRVFYFFYQKCGCSKKVSNLLAELLSVPYGPKGSSDRKVLARGFSTSTRLALWCNLNLFLKICRVSKRFLKNNDVRVAIFVDDIGITASNTSKNTMELLINKIENILSSYDPNQKLSLNQKKDIKMWTDKNMEHLGLNLGRNSVTPGMKTRSKFEKIKNKLKNLNLSAEERIELIRKKNTYKGYSKYIKSLKNTNTL